MQSADSSFIVHRLNVIWRSTLSLNLEQKQAVVAEISAELANAQECWLSIAACA
jgi:hypothetical protein